jgi:DNA-binding MarR family transcriptional regulator
MRDGMVRTASDFAHDLQHDSGALTRVIDQLEKRGLVARRRSSQDRRRVELALTPAGDEMIRNTLPSVVEQANAALRPLSRAEFLQLRKHLSRMLEHVERQRDDANDVAVSPRSQKARRPRTAASATAKPARKRPGARKAAKATR